MITYHVKRIQLQNPVRSSPPLFIPSTSPPPPLFFLLLIAARTVYLCVCVYAFTQLRDKQDWVGHTHKHPFLGPHVYTMPPKTQKADKNAKPKKVSAQQQALDQAVVDAKKLLKQHEVQRVQAEREDKAQRDAFLLDATLEKQRLGKERDQYVAAIAHLREEEQLAYKEYEKHVGWRHVPDASRLPDVHKEGDINAFLGLWKEEEAALDAYAPETTVIASNSGPAASNNALSTMSAGGTVPHHFLFLRGEQKVSATKRRAMIDEELHRCLEAYELTKAIERERDQTVLVACDGDGGGSGAGGVRPTSATTVSSDNYAETLSKVHDQILHALDVVTINTLLYYDEVLEDTTDGETLMKSVPADSPLLKLGIWVKVKDVTRSFTSLVFPSLEIRLDPKALTLPKLPKALGLSKENVAVRVVQLAFDPHCGCSSKGKEYYALNCTFKVDLLSFSHRPHENGAWRMRAETQEEHELHCEPYPPLSLESRSEDPSFRISFEVPPTLVIRQPTLLVGKWMESKEEWEPCSHTTFGAAFGGTARVETRPRRATFVTNELALFGVLLEKVFDAPFESWSLRPLGFDQVLLTLEGRHRGDASDREFRVLIEDAACKLILPDDVELEPLRASWTEPATLFRELARAGFSFLLDDEDAKYMDRVVPKSRALEEKAYRDMSQFCQYYAISSSRHNKHGEDCDMGLFRLSRQCRPTEEDKDVFDYRMDHDEVWHSIRYRVENCAMAAFVDSEDHADLNVLRGCETHLNLYTLLLPLKGEEELRDQLTHTNFLLRRCVYQLLMLLRPLSWG